MSANVKIGDKTYTGVDSMSATNADKPNEQVTFNLGGGSCIETVDTLPPIDYSQPAKIYGIGEGATTKFYIRKNEIQNLLGKWVLNAVIDDYTFTAMAGTTFLFGYITGHNDHASKFTIGADKTITSEIYLDLHNTVVQMYANGVWSDENLRKIDITYIERLSNIEEFKRFMAINAVRKEWV